MYSAIAASVIAHFGSNPSSPIPITDAAPSSTVVLPDWVGPWKRIPKGRTLSGRSRGAANAEAIASIAADDFRAGLATWKRQAARDPCFLSAFPADAASIIATGSAPAFTHFLSARPVSVG